MLETSSMTETSVYIMNMEMKQLCNRKVRDFAIALRVRNVSGLLRNGPLFRKAPKAVSFSGSRYMKLKLRYTNR